MRPNRRATYPNDNEDKHDAYDPHDRALEPQLTVLDIEPHLDHVAHEFRVSRELLADPSAHILVAVRRVADNQRRDDHEGGVGDGVVAVEAHEGGDALHSRLSERRLQRIRTTHLRKAKEADETRQRRCCEVGRQQSPYNLDAIHPPHIARRLPLRLRFPSKRAPEGENADCEDEVEACAQG